MKWLLLACVLAIFSLGLVMVFDTSSAEVIDRSLPYSVHRAWQRQLVYLCISVFSGWIVYSIGWKEILKMSPLLLGIATVMLLLVLVPGVGVYRNGARRWLGIGQFTIQPSEFLKYLLPVTALHLLSVYPQCRQKFRTFLVLILTLMVPVAFVLLEPDNGSVLVILASLVPVFIAVRVPLRYWFVPLCLLLSIGGVVAWHMPYVQKRLFVYLHPESDLRGRGHQPYQAKIAAGSGCLWGKGPGAGLQKLTYLPEAQNDYIVAIYAEEFGFIGMVFLIVLYMGIFLIGHILAMRSPCTTSAALVMVIIVMVGMQAFLNLGVVSGLLPSKGVNLPFFSQGGSSLLANMLGIALILSVDGQSEKDRLSGGRDGRTYRSRIGIK